MKLLVAICFLEVCAAAQPASGRLEFEVATVKPSNADENSSGWTTAKVSTRMRNFTLRRLILTAYQMTDAQVSGGPKWMGSDRYDIDAKPPEAADTPQLLDMLKTLLAERFQLKLHSEKKDISGYALVVAKGGLKIPPLEGDGGAQTGMGRGVIDAKRTHFDKLAELLGRTLGVPVADQTGVAGGFDFKLEWSPDDRAQKAGDAGASIGPSLFTALQETLGLKLESRKASMDVLIVDNAEKPGEN